MVLLISLYSLLGVLFVPLLNKNNSRGKILYQYIYALMIALGASALFCDAVLHLIPEVINYVFSVSSIVLHLTKNVPSSQNKVCNL